MKVKVIKDCTLTVKAGQVVDVSEQSATAALRLGFAKEPEKKKK